MSGADTNGVCSIAPALLITSDTSVQSRAAAAISPGLVMSNRTGTTRVSVTSMVLGSRAPAYTLAAPESRSTCVNSLPNPRLAPVTSAVMPSICRASRSVIGVLLSLHCGQRGPPGGSSDSLRPFSRTIDTFRVSDGVRPYTDLFQLVVRDQKTPTERLRAYGPHVWPHLGRMDSAFVLAHFPS